MRAPVLALLLTVFAASPLLAQDAADAPDAATVAKGLDGSTSGQGTSTSMGDLLKQGFEIKAAVPSGTTNLIIFMQKEKVAYACEFTSLANTRCGSIN